MDTSKAIELIEKAEHIAVLIPPEPDLDCLASAETLISFLVKRQKLVGFLAKAPGRETLAEHFPATTSSPALPREFVVSLDTATSPIAQLRYEKAEGRVDIIFSPKGQAVSKDALSFREGKTLCDCVIALGVQNIEGAGADADLLRDTPILNLDVSGQNTQYGEVNLVSPEKSSLAELVYDLVTHLSEDPLDKSASTLMLAALQFRTNCFSANTTADTLLTASELMRLGADLARARALAIEAKPASLLQLEGRAMVRSRLDESKGVLWSFITAEDLAKTGRDPADLPLVLNHLQKEFPPHRVTALLSQNTEGGVVSVLLGGERALLETLKTRGAGKFQSPHLCISSSFESFREAEEIVGSLLKGLA